MKRNIDSLAGETFDLTVIGGGIHGAMTAFLASLSGVSVALIEKNDFCGATSANSLKILHGGLRYLQHMDLPRIRDSIESRRWFLANFPHLVKPLKCLMPTYGLGIKSRAAMTAGLALNDVISFCRNYNVESANHLRRGKVISKTECAKIIPFVSGNSGGAVWYDALALNTERIVFEMLHNFSANGGKAANYVSVEDITREGLYNTVACCDQETKQNFKIFSRYVVNTAGPFYSQLPCLNNEIEPYCKGWSKAINIIVGKSLFPEYAVGLEGVDSFVDKDAVIQKGKRLFFFVPWKKQTMIGTVYSNYEDPSKTPVVSQKELLEIVSEINQILPVGMLTPEDIVNYHVGLVPSKQVSHAGSFDISLDKKEVVVEHKAKELNNVISVKTVKYTTAYSVAKQVLGILFKKGLPCNKNWKKSIEKPILFDDNITSFDNEYLQVLQLRFGRQLEKFKKCLTDDDFNSSGDLHGVSSGEVMFAVEEEMALHLDDVLLRRIGGCEKASAETIKKVAGQMAEYFGWTDKETKAQVQRLKTRFAPLVNNEDLDSGH